MLINDSTNDVPSTNSYYKYEPKAMMLQTYPGMGGKPSYTIIYYVAECPKQESQSLLTDQKGFKSIFPKEYND